MVGRAYQEPRADRRKGCNMELIICPYCQAKVNGNAEDIDSGYRKHLEYCEEYQLNEDADQIISIILNIFPANMVDHATEISELKKMLITWLRES